MTSRAPGWALLALFMLVTAACTGEAEPAPTGTVQAAPEPTATATAEPAPEPTPEPTEAALTVEEAQEVLDDLAPIEGDVFRMLKYAGDEVPPPAYERLEAVHAEPSLSQGRAALPLLLADAQESESLRGGDPAREALDVRADAERCVEVEVRRDFTDVFAESPVRFGVTALVPSPVNEWNSTGWRIADEFAVEDEGDLADLRGTACDGASA